jgi:hypothetical protein
MRANMRQIASVLTVFLLAGAALALDPAKVTMTNYRGEAVSAASDQVFYRGETIHLTNCVLYAGTGTSSGVENLSNVTVTVTWGGTDYASATVTGAVQNATGGVWDASITLRAGEAATTYLQVTISNSATSYTYPQRTITTKSKL